MTLIHYLTIFSGFKTILLITYQRMLLSLSLIFLKLLSPAVHKKEGSSKWPGREGDPQNNQLGKGELPLDYIEASKFSRFGAQTLPNLNTLQILATNLILQS